MRGLVSSSRLNWQEWNSSGENWSSSGGRFYGAWFRNSGLQLSADAPDFNENQRTQGANQTAKHQPKWIH
jgi:hypothetical protein